MPRKSDFSISCALICDDYRVENNGKGLIIGAYGNKIGFVKKPDVFTFCICLLGMAERAFDVEIRAEFIPDGGSQKSEWKVSANVGRGDPASDGPFSLFIPIKGITLPMSGAGKLLIKVRAKGEKRWKQVTETVTEINPNYSIEQRRLS
jgi:hypothetical protein